MTQKSHCWAYTSREPEMKEESKKAGLKLNIEKIQPLWRTVRRFLKKLEIELPYDPAIPLLGIYTEKTIIQNDLCAPVFIAALFTIA